MGKEFVLIFVDEIMNKSLSLKIDHLKKFYGNQKLYSENMVKKV